MSHEKQAAAQQECPAKSSGTMTFGELNFGNADLGDARRTKRLSASLMQSCGIRELRCLRKWEVRLNSKPCTI